MRCGARRKQFSTNEVVVQDPEFFRSVLDRREASDEDDHKRGSSDFHHTRETKRSNPINEVVRSDDISVYWNADQVVDEHESVMEFKDET